MSKSIGCDGKRNPDTKLTQQQERFLFAVLSGKSLTEAYIEAYPSRCAKVKRETACIYASKLFAEERVQKRYTELVNEFREREKTKIGWSREQSIESLRFVIEANKKDLERIEIACEEELLNLKELCEQETDPNKVREFVEEIINKRKRTRANKTNNDGIISSVAELNKMHGYNEQTINMNGTVIFEGEEELPE